MKKLFFLFLIYTSTISGQDSSKLSKFNFEIYGDFFVNGTASHVPSHKISDILYSYNRTNEFGINMLYLKTSFIDSNFRMNLAMMTGTYSIDNYADEPQLFQNLLEGNVGFKLSRKSNTWLDVGVFPSHIGFESAVGYDCWNISRSLLAENSPYYETGVKLTNTSKNEKFTQSYLIINGWQRITMIPGHSIPSLGMQFVYKPNSKTVLNYSNFIGSYRPDSTAALRVYNNFFGTYQLTDKLTTLLNFDLGMDKNLEENYNPWFGANLSFRYLANKKHSLSLRTEFINDPNDVLYPQLNFGWGAWSSSVNWDIKLNSFALLRSELKYMQSDHAIFLPNELNHLGIFVALQVKL
jgi:hypothetical protein